MRKTEAKQSADVEVSASRKGVITRLLGVVAIILGFLNSMLSWRGGFAVDPFYLVLILGGVLLYITGSVAGRR